MICTFEQLGRYGRFANGLYQVASVIGIARKNGFEFQFPLWKNHDHAERFGSTEDIDLHQHFVNPLPLLKQAGLPDRFIQWGYHDVRLSHDVSLSGHLQSRKYFDHCFDEVLHYLQMKDQPEATDYVSIHWRAGDYEANDNGYHPRLGIDYYKNAIEHFPAATRFMVFSDDTEAVQDMFTAQFGNDRLQKRFIYYQGDYISSFKHMRACKDFIIGNSSYSAMAATLNRNAKVVAPVKWFGAIAGLNAKDIYCPGWIVL